MSSYITGLDALQKRLGDLSKKAESLNGTRNVSFTELFDSRFMKANTVFNSMTELFEKGGFKVESQEDFAAIPEEPFDKFIADNSKFKNWDEMKSAAGTEWAKKQLGF